MNLIEKIARIKKNEKISILIEKKIVNKKLMEFFKKIKASKEIILFEDENVLNERRDLLKKSDVIVICFRGFDIYSEDIIDFKNTKKLILLVKPTKENMKFFEVSAERFKEIVNMTKKISNFLERENKIKIVFNENSKVILRKNNRPVIEDGLPIKKGMMSILPLASVSFAPIEESLNGKIEIKNGVLEFVKGMKKNEKVSGLIEFKDGFVVKTSKCIEKVLKCVDEEGRKISHLTFGTNKFIKNDSESFLIERTLGGVCIGLGNNQGDFKGNNKSKFHIDISSVFEKIIIEGRSKIIITKRGVREI